MLFIQTISNVNTIQSNLDYNCYNEQFLVPNDRLNYIILLGYDDITAKATSNPCSRKVRYNRVWPNVILLFVVYVICNWRPRFELFVFSSFINYIIIRLQESILIFDLLLQIMCVNMDFFDTLRHQLKLFVYSCIVYARINA